MEGYRHRQSGPCPSSASCSLTDHVVFRLVQKREGAASYFAREAALNCKEKAL